jgi:hypothetical protein
MIGVRVGVLVGLAVALCGQTKPKDVDGWDKIKWGMTIAEARSVYSIQKQPESNDDWTLLTLSPVKIGNVQMGVQVGARHGTEKITSVRLWSYFGLPSSPPAAGSQDFDALRTIFIQKYGDPAKEETERGENFRLIKTVRWTLPSTSILMTLEQSAAIPNVGTILLDYTAADKPGGR